MFSLRSFRRLALCSFIALVGGCGSNPARVLTPGPATRARDVGAERQHRLPDDSGPCTPDYPGPVLTLSGPGLKHRYPTGGYCICPETQATYTLPANKSVKFHWSADASAGCTNIRSYRWSLDIEDLSDKTPRIDEATDLKHWSAPSLDAKATIGPFTFSATPAENVHYLYVDAEDGVGYRSLGIIRITVVESDKHTPHGQSSTTE